MNGDRLTWLLRALSLSGKELADRIGVDHSTLSKWRRGVRTLKYTSPYAQKIASLALESPIEKENGVVRRMLCEAYPGLDGDDPERLENALRTWLTVPEQPDAAPTDEVFAVPLETSIGIENLFAAQRRLFAMLRDLPDGQEIIVTDFGAVDWAHVGASRIEDGVRSNMEALDGGRHTMRIIDQVTDTYRPWELMFQWLPIYLQPGVSAWAYYSPAVSPLRQNMILIRGHAALVMSSTAAAPDLVVSSLYRAPEYVRLFGSAVESIRSDSRPMMQVTETSQLISYLHLVESRMKSGCLLYMINRLPTFRTMPPELLEEVLRSNHVSEEHYSLCMEAGRQASATRGRCESRQLYDLDAIRTALTQNYIVDADLTAVVGREIRVTREQFRRQLAFLRESIAMEHYTLALYPFSELEIDTLPPCSLLVQYRSLAAAWDAEQYSRRLYSESPSIVNGFYQYADMVWEHVPLFVRTAQDGRHKIDSLLAE